MQSLALITPWPPQSSGIADYAYDLATGLAEQDVRVSVFTNELSPHSAGAPVQLHTLPDFPGPEAFDQVVFQMGNSAEYHAAMLPLLAQYGGIVHLHDVVLHHLFAQLTCGQGNRRLYLRALEHWYGREVRDRIHDWATCGDGTAHFWESGSVTDVPLFELAMQYASSCIVHSEFSKQRVEDRFPRLPCAVIPQVYRDMQVADSTPGRQFRIGVFGMIQPNKHVDAVFKAIAYAAAEGVEVHLDVAGSLHGDCETLPKLAAELGIEQCVTFHGRTEHAEFLRIMRSVDLHIALRYPTMGECSAVVSRTLQMGVPAIVSNLGWYAELPAFVDKLPIESSVMQSKLNELVLRHATDSEHHRSIRDTARHYATEQVEFCDIVARYRELLHEFPSSRAA